jgi:iron-sulfur cluster assembly accessory protein
VAANHDASPVDAPAKPEEENSEMRGSVPPGLPGPDITVTPQAAQEIKKLIQEEQRQDRTPQPRYLRLRIEGNLEDGFQNHLELDVTVRADDLRVETRDIVLVLDRRTAILGMGATIDYVDTVGRKGLTVRNPNAK